MLVLEVSAWAYTDPGSGALLWQALLASFFGLCFYGRRILQRLSILRKDPPPTESGPAKEE